MANETLNVILKLVTGQYKQEAREAATATRGIGDAATTASGGTSKLGTALTNMRGVAVAAGAALAATAVAKFAVDSIQAASNLDESINAVNKTFGAAASTIESFGQVSAQAVGLSTREFNQLATVTGSMLTNLGLDQAAAAKETVRLTQRASDMASVFNTDVGTALAAINSALKGEANPIEQFGVKLNDAAVRARAVELGLAATTAAVDANGKATATLSLIYEQTNKTAGDFAQTADGLANSQRRAAAAMENAQARFGKAVTPALANLMDRFAEGIERVAIFFGDKGAKNALVFNEAMKAISDEMAAGTLGTEDLANALLHMALNADLTTAEVETLAAAAGLGADQWDIFAESLLEQAELLGLPKEVIEEIAAAIGGIGLAAGESKAPVEEATEVIGSYGTAAQRAASHARAVASAQRAITQALLEAANPAFAAATAIGRLQDAQENLADVQDDSKSSASDIAQAQLDVAAAVLETQAALDAFDAGGISGAASAIATALQIPYEQALLLLETLGLIDGMTVTATVVTNFVDRGSAAAGDGSGRTYPGGRQHGGPVLSGQAYIVGERGRELFVPQQSGMIIPNSGLANWGSSMTVGGARSVTFNLPVAEGPVKPLDLQYLALLANHMTLLD